SAARLLTSHVRNVTIAAESLVGFAFEPERRWRSGCCGDGGCGPRYAVLEDQVTIALTVSRSAVRMLAFGNFLPLTLPNFRLEDQKILVVFPPAFQLIHHLPRWRSANWATICLKRWSSERLFLSRTDKEPGRDLIFTSRSLRRAPVSLRAQP